MKTLLREACERATSYLEGLDDRRVFPAYDDVAGLVELAGPLPENGVPAHEVLARLAQFGSPATVATAGPRYFGFVVGGVLPAALAANWLAGAWDQPASLYAGSPAAAEIEAVALGWLLDVLGLPGEAAGGFVTGATMANLAGLAAARHSQLQRAGWNVEAQGLFGAPELKVVVGDEVHVSLLKALSILGFGHDRVLRVPVDGQGRMRADVLPALDEMTILCLQAGNVNTGAFDPFEDTIAAAHRVGAWVHVDGAFGLWVAACPSKAHLAAGMAAADSWATDGHKWLNVPYDSGMVFCRHPEALRGAMQVNAPYLAAGARREPYHTTPEMSRRARGVEVWAALCSLGRSGLAELIERNCRFARAFAAGLEAAGFRVLNEVELNQVMVSFGDAARTRQVIEAVQADGTCWCGGTVWQGNTAMRISVSSWATTEADVERSLEAIKRIAGLPG